jgi:hypothetical protein
MGFDIIKSIKAYHDNNYGLAWDIFWDYQCAYPLDSQKDLRDYSTQLFVYLCCFGMGRGSTKLAYSNLDKFTEFVNDSKDILITLSTYRLLDITERDKESYNNDIIKLKGILKEYDISSSNIMVTKIIMGVTGKCVAIDSFFENTYRYYYDSKPKNVFDTLLIVKNSYTKNWQKRFDELDKRYLQTRRTSKNNIPVARLIDMGFWWYNGGKE